MADFSDQKFDESFGESAAPCIRWQLMGTSTARFSGVLLILVEKNVSFYILSFNFSIYRKVSPALKEDLPLFILHCAGISESSS
jgi:hypothetical protein